MIEKETSAARRPNFATSETGDDPYADLGEADSANSQDLAGHHLFGADGGEQDLEDAGSLLFNDGTGHVHPVEEDDEVHQEEESVDAGEGGVLVFADEIDRLEERVDVGRRHAQVAQTFASESRANALAKQGRREDVGLGFRNPFEGGPGMRRRGRSDPDVAVELAVSEPVVEEVARVGGRGRDDVDLRDPLPRAVPVGVDMLFALKLGLEVGAELRILGDDRDVQVGAGTSVGERSTIDETTHEQRNKDGHDEEAFCADALEVLALCNEPDVKHRHFLLRFR